jgi:hypothetical protein
MHLTVGKLVLYVVGVDYSLVDRWCTPCEFVGAVQCKTCRVTCAYTDCTCTRILGYSMT